MVRPTQAPHIQQQECANNLHQQLEVLQRSFFLFCFFRFFCFVFARRRQAHLEMLTRIRRFFSGRLFFFLLFVFLSARSECQNQLRIQRIRALVQRRKEARCFFELTLQLPNNSSMAGTTIQKICEVGSRRCLVSPFHTDCLFH